jgi:hypothetical protein
VITGFGSIATNIKLDQERGVANVFEDVEPWRSMGRDGS